MAVYTDFYYYETEVYQATWGYLEGYHAIWLLVIKTILEFLVVVLYCKNSWGTTWGIFGYLKFATK